MLAYLILVHADGEPIDPELIARFEQAEPPEQLMPAMSRLSSNNSFFGLGGNDTLSTVYRH